MSDCGVCLTSEIEDYDYTIDSHSIVVLAEDAECCECRKIIPAGKPVEEATWYDDGWNYSEDRETVPSDFPPSILTCVICAEIATAFFCGPSGRIWNGDIWERFSDEGAFEGLTSACFDRLSTPEAKAELQRRWIEWKGLRA